MIDYPNELNIIFDKLNNYSIKPIIIGGYVRDFLLNKSSKDIDIELYGIASYEKLEKLLQEFGSVNSVGKSFGVCKLQFDDLDLDFSLPRIDSKINKGHKGFEIQTDETLDFITATSRRDFTINAIGYDVIEKKILDPFNGIEDLNNSLLRAVDITKFEEDPLRVLRAVQFSARFGFKLDTALFEKCKAMMHNNVLEQLPRERIFTEIKKLLLKSKKPSNGLVLLKKLHGFLFFNELNELNKEDFILTRNAIDYLATNISLSEKKKLILSLALLTYALSSENRESFLEKLTSEKKVLQDVIKQVEVAKTTELKNVSDYDIYLLATKVNIEEFGYFLQALYLGEMDAEIQNLQERAKELTVLRTPLKPLIEGKDLITLKLQPSKEFSNILDIAYNAQMKQEFHTKTEALEWLKNYILELSISITV